MKNGKAIAIISTLKKHNIEINESIAFEILSAITTRQEAEYEIGDFVVFYEGMGEIGYGTIIENVALIYKIQTWTHNPDQYPSYIHTVTRGDMRGLSSPEEAMEYYLIRSGQKN